MTHGQYIVWDPVCERTVEVSLDWYERFREERGKERERDFVYKDGHSISWPEWFEKRG